MTWRTVSVWFYQQVTVIGCGTTSLQGDTKFADTMGLMAGTTTRPLLGSTRALLEGCVGSTGWFE